MVDCQHCGACCTTDLWAIVVNPGDSTPRHLSLSVRKRVGFASWEADEGIRMMRAPEGRCISLQGEIGASVRCSCYSRRPSNCREFEPGSAGCVQARQHFGLVGDAMPFAER